MANHESTEKRARQTIKKTEGDQEFYRTRLKNISKSSLEEKHENNEQKRS